MENTVISRSVHFLASRGWVHGFGRYAIALAAVTVSTLLRWMLDGVFGSSVVFVTFYPAVAVVGMVAGGRAGLVATALSALAADFFFIEPRRSIMYASFPDMIALGLFVSAGVLMSWMAGMLGRARRREWELAEREKAGAKLRESEERLRFALETSHTGAWELNLGDHTAHRSALHDRIFGYPELQPQWTYEIFLEHVLPEDRAMVDTKFRGAVETGTDWSFECRIRRADQQVRWIWAAGRHRMDAAGKRPGLAGIVQDITERKKAEEELLVRREQLQKANDLLSGIIESTSDLISAVGTNLNYLAFNEAYRKECQIIFGREPQLGGGSLELLVHLPDDQQRATRLFERALQGESVYATETFGDPDRSRRVYELRFNPIRDSGGRIIGATQIGRDVTKQKRAEEALQLSESRLRTFFHSDMVGAIYWNMDGQITEANDKFLQIVGYSRQDLLSGHLNWFRMTPPEYRLLDEQAIAELKATGVEKPYEKEYIRKDGTRVPIIIGAAMLDERRYEGLAFLIDNTDRKRSEEALRQSEAQLRVAAMAAEIGMWSWKPGTSHVVVSANWRRLFGVADGVPVTFETWQNALHPEDRDRAVRELNAANEEQREFNVEYRTLHADGTVRWIIDRGRTWLDEQNQPVGMAGVNVDITKRKLAENEKHRLALQRQLALDAARLGWWHYDPVRKIVTWDDRYREIFGESGHQQPIEEILKRLHPEDLPRVWAAVETSLNPADPQPYSAEYRIFLDDRSVRWVEAHGIASFEGEGGCKHAVSFVGTVQDITERKQFQVELERVVAERTAKLQELVGELEHFSYSITHDMRAPLRAMQGFADLMTESCGTCLEQEPKGFLRRIRTSAARMDALITDALNYSRTVRQELVLVPVDAGALLRGMLDSYPELQPSRAQVEIKSELPVVMANEAGLTQCFSNLLNNAVKFVKPGQMPRIRVWSETRGEWVRIWVEDEGIGIADSMRPRVFDMFSRGHQNYEGTGIGLALVRKVMDRMGGEVGVESQEGQGSRFWLELRRVNAFAR